MALDAISLIAPRSLHHSHLTAPRMQRSKPVGPAYLLSSGSPSMSPDQPLNLRNAQDGDAVRRGASFMVGQIATYSNSRYFCRPPLVILSRPRSHSR